MMLNLRPISSWLRRDLLWTVLVLALCSLTFQTKTAWGAMNDPLAWDNEPKRVSATPRIVSGRVYDEAGGTIIEFFLSDRQVAVNMETVREDEILLRGLALGASQASIPSSSESVRWVHLDSPLAETVRIRYEEKIKHFDQPRLEQRERRLRVLLPLKGAETSTGPAPGGSVENSETIRPAESVEAATLLGENPEAAENSPGSLSLPEGVRLGGYLLHHSAYRSHSPRRFASLLNRLDLNLSSEISPWFSFTGEVWAQYDAVFDLFHDYSAQVGRDMRSDVIVRQAYCSLDANNFLISLGKQHIVWGETVGGLFVADAVTPKDLREFILPPVADIRKSIWALDVQWYAGNAHLEFVWFPSTEFHDLAEPGYDFYFPMRFAKELTARGSVAVQEPPVTLNNSSVGLRFSHLYKGWSTSFFALHRYDYFPSLAGAFTPTSTLPAERDLVLRYERLSLFGSTFSKDILGSVLRGEFLYTHNKPFRTQDPLEYDGLVDKDTIDYVLAIDHTFYSKLDTNFQFLQKWILNCDPELIEHQKDSYISLWAQSGFFNNTIQPEIFFAFQLEEPNYLVRPRVTFRFGNKTKLIVGYDEMGGDEDLFFGQFTESDRFYTYLYYFF
uniref:Uncharacterized protein n=1 Tax=Desulfacinum infernum TaxID=35837 RepID=A0A831ZN94_9BACT